MQAPASTSKIPGPRRSSRFTLDGGSPTSPTSPTSPQLATHQAPSSSTTATSPTASNPAVSPTSPTSSGSLSSNTSQPAPSSPTTPEDRLDALLKTITSVFQAYSNLPTRSATHMASLREFHRRAVALHPTGGEGVAFVDRGRGMGATSASSPTAGHEGSGGHRGVQGNAGHGGTGRSFSTTTTVGDAATPVQARLPDHAAAALPAVDAPKVDALEHDWWSSEIVAAWYGPRKGVRNGSEKARRAIRDTGLRRDPSYVGLYDE